jgi:hypothetical protein
MRPLVLAALLCFVAAACGGGSPAGPSPSPSAPATSNPTEATGTAAVTPTGTTPTASATSPPLRLDGVEPLELSYDAQTQPVPPGHVVYFSQVRPQSETITTRLRRAYRDANDDLHFDELTAPLRARSAVAADPYTFAMSLDGSRMYAGVCVPQGLCGVGIMRPRDPGEAIPAAMQSEGEGVAFMSEDGGVTWTEIGSLPTGHTFVAVTGADVIVSRGFDGSTFGGFYFYGSGETVAPPVADGWPSLVPGVGITWRSRLNAGPGTVVAPGVGRVHEALFPGSQAETLIALNGDGTRLVSALLANGPGSPGTWVVATVDAGGAIVSAVTTEFILTAQPAPAFGPDAFIFWGDVADTPDHAAPRTTMPFLAFTSGRSALPMLELFEVVDEYMSPIVEGLVDFGAPPLRVNTPGECLNVRTMPSRDASVLTCAADGVLLRDRGETDGEWVAVEAPGGLVGWVAGELVGR